MFIWQRQTLTSFGLKVGYAVHDDMMQEQRLVVDFYVSGEKAIEVSHVPADKGKYESKVSWNTVSIIKQIKAVLKFQTIY